MRRVETAADAAALLAGRRFVSAEFMYRPRPPGGRERVVFDFTFRSRLTALGSQDGVLLLCDSPASADSLAPLVGAYPALVAVTLVVNPLPYPGSDRDTPRRCAWDDPDGWQRRERTDRWARIDAALQVGGLIGGDGMLVMPAHDAVWGSDLLPRLRRFAERHARAGLPAAVSPYTPHQAAPVPGADIPREVIDTLNAALVRDPFLRWKIRADRVQAFWGKMGLLPFALCAPVRQSADMTVWEDDLELDRIVRALGFGVRCQWIGDPAVYRLSPPVFDFDGLRRVIDRTLHYSLSVGRAASGLSQPPGRLRRLRAFLDPAFGRAAARGDALIAECSAALSARLERFGASWVDWGAYRYVARVGNPVVEVWRHLPSSRTGA